MRSSPGRLTFTPGWRPISPVLSPDPAGYCWRFPERYKRPLSRRGLRGLATMIIQGRAAAEPTLRRAVSAFLGDQVSGEEWLQWGIFAQMAAMAVWDFDSWMALSARHVELA